MGEKRAVAVKGEEVVEKKVKGVVGVGKKPWKPYENLQVLNVQKIHTELDEKN